MNNQIIHFNEGDVEVTQHSFFRFSAREARANWQQAGYGSTMLEAIANLNEKLKEVE